MLKLRGAGLFLAFTAAFEFNGVTGRSMTWTATLNDIEAETKSRKTDEKSPCTTDSR